MAKYCSIFILIAICFLPIQASELPEACRHFLAEMEALDQDSVDQAKEYAHLALNEVHSSIDSVQCFNRIAITFFHHYGAYKAAKQYSGQALDMKLDSLFATAQACYYHAQSLYELGEQAMVMARLYQKAATLSQQHQHLSARFLEGYSLQKLARYYTVIGDTERANANYNRALIIGQMKELQRYPLAANCLIEMGIAYYVEQAYEAANSCYQKALSLASLHSIKKALIYYRLGELYTAMGRYKEAMAFQDQALSIYKDWEDPFGILEVHAQRAEMLLEMGQYEHSANLLLQVIDTFQAYMGTEDDRDLGIIYLAAANAFLAQKGYEESLSYFQQALQMIMPDSLASDPRIQPRPDQLYAENIFQDALTGKGKAFLARYKEQGRIGDLEAAFSSFCLAMMADDRLREEFGSVSNKDILATETHWRTELALETAILLEREKGSMIDTVFALMEHSRAMDLYGHVMAAKATLEEGIPQEILSLKAEMKSEVFTCESYWSDESKAVIDSACAQSRHQYDSLLHELESHYPAFRMKTGQFDRETITDIQQQLAPEEALIEYFWGEHALYGLMIRKNQLDWQILDDQGSVANVLQDLQLNEAGETVQRCMTLHELYRLLLKPFEPLPYSLILVPDASLSYLPFEALLKDQADSIIVSELQDNFWKGSVRVDGGAEYLLYHHTIQYAHSATLRYASQQKQRQHSRMLAFAPVYTDQDSFGEVPIPPLSGNVEHVDRLKQIMSGSSFVGEQARSSHFLQHAADYDVLHLALHGYANADNPLQAALAFSSIEGNSGIVNAASLYGLPPLKAQLVSLLSCETGAGQYAQGEGVMSLGRAFRYAGANSVLMSLWQADLGPGMQILESFYQYLAEGIDKSRALQQAKLDWLAEADAIGAHPSKWANYILIGDGSPLASSNSMWPYVLGSVLMLGLIGIFIKNPFKVFVPNKRAG